MAALFSTSILRVRGAALVVLAGAAMAATTAHASTIFTSNLSSITTPSGCTTCSGTGSNFQLGFMGGSVTGITNTFFSGTTWGFNFVYSSPSSANLLGAYNQGGSQSIKLGSAVTADAADSQDGGYFLALDSVYQASPINISINTIVGDTYTVSFDWGGTQQPGYPGPTTDALSVGLTGSTPSPQSTGSTGSIPTGGFSGWMSASEIFTATSTGTQVLSFLASGTPNGTGQQPAMTLLDNISVSQSTPTGTPEPSSLLLLSTGLLGLGGFVRSRFTK